MSVWMPDGGAIQEYNFSLSRLNVLCTRPKVLLAFIVKFSFKAIT